VTIWHGDARALPLHADSIDLVVTSWPYNARVTCDDYSDWLPWRDYWDGLIAPFLAEAFRVLRHGGRLALITQNVMQVDDSGSSIHVGGYVGQYAQGAGFLPPRERITWVKADQPKGVTRQSTAWDSEVAPLDPMLRATSELVWIFDKGARRHMPRNGATSDVRAAELEKWTGNTWYITRGNADHVLGHSAILPLELPYRLIKLYSYVGDTVLDPFMGVGTTLRAAKSLRRVGLGVEQSMRYCRLAASLCAQQPPPRRTMRFIGS
jgi:site-specific DNA-methyltransferase (adenine-specific)